ncbi:MAG: branched-chain amino acid ABC transporter permease [Rhodospirillales bacterium]|nr:branched-chain amino acid ABC transporter permease [Rhodospirillales bacterium]
MMSRAKILSLLIGFLVLVALPPVTTALDADFYMGLAARMMIFAIAAISLDLLLGYGGMVSFGHAAYLGTGSYAVAILAFYEITNGFLQFAVAVGASALVALIIGFVCLRTKGVYFIMITLALTQMLYFLGISLEEYGGDDGINTDRSEFFEWFDLGDDTNLYYLILFFLVLSLWISWRLINSRFGMVIRGSQSNDDRMQAIGFPTFRYKLTMFVIAGVICGVAGFLLANLTEFVTPEYMHWFRSGEIMIMVLVGGMGTLFGPVFGAIAYLLFEEVISDFTEHWMIIFGPILVLLVLFARKGVWGMLPGRERGDD